MKNDLRGQRFGRLTAIRPTQMRTSGKNIVWECMCDCGNIVYIGSGTLKVRDMQSCGCYRKERAANLNKTHGGRNERLYGVWMDMRRRCNDPKMTEYTNYGGRGIRVSNEFEDYSFFREWAMQNGYNPLAPKGEYTLDRIDVNGDYSPSNCRWITITQQQLNKSNSLLITYKNKTQNASQWDKEMAYPCGTVAKRYGRKWELERIFTQPVNISV